MMSDGIVLAILATIIGFVGYVPYFRDIFKGKTKPHIFSWFVWGLLIGIDFVVQITRGGGAGSWVTGFSSVVCLTIAALALVRGEKEITRADWICFVVGIIGIILWFFTKNPFLTVVLIAITDAVAFIPTFRKTYKKPYEETLMSYVCTTLKWVIGVAALRSLTVTIALYPVSLVLTNSIFISMVIWRRRSLANGQANTS
jgi:hypothetical protein